MLARRRSKNDQSWSRGLYREGGRGWVRGMEWESGHVGEGVCGGRLGVGTGAGRDRARRECVLAGLGHRDERGQKWLGRESHDPDCLPDSSYLSALSHFLRSPSPPATPLPTLHPSPPYSPELAADSSPGVSCRSAKPPGSSSKLFPKIESAPCTPACTEGGHAGSGSGRERERRLKVGVVEAPSQNRIGAVPPSCTQGGRGGGGGVAVRG